MEERTPLTLGARIGESLRTSKLATLLEIIVVIVPMQILLIIGNRVGDDFVSLPGDLVLLGGRVAWIGAALALVLAWSALRLRGSGWRDLGMGRPKSLLRTALMSLGVTVAVLIALVVVSQLAVVLFPNAEAPDVSRFDPLRGNPGNFIINVIAVWLTAAFLEEMLMRAFLMNRLAELAGKTKSAWAGALLVSAVIFGSIHFYQGPSGMVLTGVAGLLFGGAYLIVRRNLWVVIIAHGLIDTLNYIQFFLSAPPE
jgi:membrane protease YdiL (CAAX protease family)